MKDLGLPVLDQHDAAADALMTAMIHVTLMDRRARGANIPRERAKPFVQFGGG